MRFARGFEYRLEADRVPLDRYLPRFCIQPLIENSFVHGLARDPARRMAIVVTVREDQRGLVVTVDDDGSGCDISTRRRLEAMFADDARSAGSGLGLAAVHHRVRTLYGERFGLRLLPSDAGFSIQLLIPKLRSS